MKNEINQIKALSQTSVMPSAFVLKKCTCCDLEFPKTEDYFFKKVIKQQNKNGAAIYHSFRSICKSCNNKKSEANRIKKRCKEMNCDVSDYRENWKKQYSETRTIDIEAKKTLTNGSYNHFIKNKKNTLKDYLFSVENKIGYKEMGIKKQKPIEHHKKYKKEYYKKDRTKLKDAYIANNILGFKINEVPKEIIETKRLIIQLKKELNYGS